MGIAEKFSNFKMKQEDRISEKDKKFLETLETVTKKTLDFYHAYYDCVTRGKEEYKDIDLDPRIQSFIVSDLGVLDKAVNLHKQFREIIFAYFRTEYRCESVKDVEKPDLGIYHDVERDHVKYGRWKETRLDIDKVWICPKYEKIVDEIINILGGMSFSELSTKEIKDKLKNECLNRYNNTWKVSVKGNVIKWTGGYISNDIFSSHPYRLNSVEFFNAFLDAYSMYLYGVVKPITGMEKFYDHYYVYLEDEDFSGITPTCEGNVIDSIKIFKNGRIDFKFNTAAQAREFARVWMGYTLV